MWSTIRIYLLILPVVFVIDFLWLGVVMSRFYKSELGVLARRAGDSLTPIWWAAFIVYLLIPLGIILFALPRVSPSGEFLSALFWGFLYGVTLYGIYDMTNYAMLQGWPIRMVFVDICWGGVLCALVTYIAVLCTRWLG